MEEVLFLVNKLLVKGTVQNLIDLNRGCGAIPVISLDKLKLLLQEIYRISGGSTQHLGVVPDIKFPSPIDAHEFGESSESSALPAGSDNGNQISTFYKCKNDLIPLFAKICNAMRIKSDRSLPIFLSKM
ncbi:MAG: hypothetical protein MZV64_25225 [Ignavibacteriales bacterium]|nr:hypothetical protein [Ignavibacteriales bacterium]